MNRQVAIVRCDTYDENEVYQALNKAFELLNVYENEWMLGKDIMLKPNLCLPAVPQAHLTTHPEIIRQLIKILSGKENRIKIGDTSIGYSDNTRSNRVWEMTQMNDIIREFGNVEKADLQKNLNFEKIFIEKEEFILPISREILETNVINVPKLKTHSYMLLTACVKNFYGILAGDAKKKFHKLIGSKERFAKLLLEINKLVNNKLNIVDAITGIEGEGPGAKGEARHIGVIVVGYDAIMVDKVLAQIINLHSSDVLTNLLGSSEEPIVLGESIDNVKICDYKLPAINPKGDRIIEHVIEAKSNHAEIDKEKCKGCGLCFMNCPASAIKKDISNYKILNDKCISCFVCIEVCPYSAISVKNSGLMQFIKGERADERKNTT